MLRGARLPALHALRDRSFAVDFGDSAGRVARTGRVGFALRWMHKDLTYALDEAAQHNVPLPTVAAAREIYRLALGQGLGDQDFAAVAEALRPKEQ